MSHLIETFIDEEREISYTFSATFDFLRRLNDKGENSAQVFAELSSGSMDSKRVLNTMSSCISDVNGEPVNDAIRDKVCIEIIENFGLQESSILACTMLSKAMVGNIKLKKIQGGKQTKAILDQLFPPLRLKDFWRAGSLWTGLSMISGGLGFLIFRYFTMHI